MRLTLDTLIVLDAIERRGSFAAAAEELHRVPSAVSYAVQKLEQDLDLAIFDRSGHRARLTEAGEALLEGGRDLLAHARRVEERVRKLAGGWESELVIAVDTLIGFGPLIPVLCEFYALNSPTRLRFGDEVLGGSWDALVARRADLAVGASGDPPSGAPLSFATRRLGTVEFIFAVAPHHPLAFAEEPIAPEALAGYRKVALADTSRSLPPRSSGLARDDTTLTVSTPSAKLAAQISGVGIGHLPRLIAAPHLTAGTLVEKRLAESIPRVPVSLVWRSREKGKALEWWIERLSALAYPGIDGVAVR